HLKLGAEPEDTYLSDSSGVDRGIALEVNCETGEGFITEYITNSMTSSIEFEPFSLSPNNAYSIAVSYACAHYLNSQR
ncbi:MAG: hypothetical protein ACYTX0_42865, partial [Nostoc sp.]